MKSYVYILKSLKTQEYYIGCSSDLERRLQDHNKGKVFATRYKVLYELVFSQEFYNNTLARKMEMKLKKWKRKDFLDKIIKDGYIKSKL